MTSAPAAPPSPGSSAARVILLGSGAASQRLARALAEAGHEVCAVRGASELERELKGGAFDAVVLDLSQPGGPKPGALERIARAIEAAPGGARRPAVLALTEGGAPPPGGPLRPDVWIAGADLERVGRQVDAIVAERRLADARGEIERLREAVTHARTTAHDLAQPLTTILARAQLLLSRTRPDDPAYRALSVICREAERLASITEKFQALRGMAAAQGGDPRD